MSAKFGKQFACVSEAKGHLRPSFLNYTFSGCIYRCEHLRDRNRWSGWKYSTTRHLYVCRTLEVTDLRFIEIHKISGIFPMICIE